MVHDLVMPQPLSRQGIEGDQAVREKIFAVTIAAVEIGFRRLGGDVNNTTLFVQRLTGPSHEAGGGFVGFGGPRIVTELFGMRNQMEYPAPQTGSDIESADSTWTTEATNDQKILIGDA